MSGIQLVSVSMGKGIVHWRVVYPHLARKHRGLAKEYRELDEACRSLKRCLRREQVAAETATLVDARVPEGEWGAEAATAT